MKWKREDGSEIQVSEMHIHHVRNALKQLENNPFHAQARAIAALQQRKKELEAS